MEEGFDDLSQALNQRKKLAEKHSKDSEIYDFNAQGFHREICLMPDDTHNTLNMPWVFDHRHGEGLAHGAYDITKLDERILEGRITRDEVEALIKELYDCTHWIPAFPLDGRNSYGFMITAILAVWLLVFVILGFTHKVIGASGFLVICGSLLFAYVASWAAAYWVNNPIGDEYLTEREREFNRIVDLWNTKHQARDFKIEVGRYGAYLSLRFQSPVKKLGAFLMHFKRQHDKEKEQKKTKRGETGKDDDLF